MVGKKQTLAEKLDPRYNKSERVDLCSYLVLSAFDLALTAIPFISLGYAFNYCLYNGHEVLATMIMAPMAIYARYSPDVFKKINNGSYEAYKYTKKLNQEDI